MLTTVSTGLYAKGNDIDAFCPTCTVHDPKLDAQTTKRPAPSNHFKVAFPLFELTSKRDPENTAQSSFSLQCTSTEACTRQ
jgi:hypothetical protein